MASGNSPQENTTVLSLSHKLGQRFARVEQRIRERAHEIFQGRESGEDDPLGDWLEAQWEILAPVELAVKEQKKNLVVEGNLKGFTPREIEIEVGARQLRVFGSHTESNSGKKAQANQHSSRSAQFYQVVPLPCEVDIGTGRATLLKNGKLKITLPKKAESQ